MRYKIIDITHSGRKGVRGTRVDEYKYDPLFGAIIKTDDICKTEQFHGMKWFLLNNTIYDYWNTSAVLGISRTKDGKRYIIETVNTIYELEVIDNEKSKN